MQKVFLYFKAFAPYLIVGTLVAFGIVQLLSWMFPLPPESDAFERRGGHHQVICEQYCKGANGVHRNTSVVELRGHFKEGRNTEDFDCVCSPDLIDTE